VLYLTKHTMKSLFIALSLTFLITSCDRPECKSNDPVFDKYTPETKEYKVELIRHLNAAGYSNVNYWIDKYIAVDGVEYMSVFIQGRGLCAKAILNISNGTGLEQYKKVKGGGYSGAGLRRLRYRIDSADGNYNFIFEQVDGIVD